MKSKQVLVLIMIVTFGFSACRDEKNNSVELESADYPISLEPQAVGANEIEYSEIPNWIEPTELADLDPTKRGLDVLLANTQERITKGSKHTYQAAAMRVNTARGLAKAGQVGAQWDPHTQVLAIHNLQIRREGEIIDVLKNGSRFTILRREKNLEQAWIDGINTATLQIEDLRIGDVVFFDYSVVSQDIVWPEAGGGLYSLVSSNNDIDTETRVIWPDDLDPSIKTPDWLEVTPFSSSQGYTEIKFSSADVPATKFESWAPSRFTLKNTVEVSMNPNWEDFSRRYSQYFELATIVPKGSELEKEIKRIKSTYDDSSDQVEAALEYTQENIRYLFVGLNSGGYVPVPAEETARLKYGDCKAKTALLLAFLKAFDINAEPVLVNSQFGDAVPDRLPSMAVFNHVIVRADIDGKSYWLDGTRTGDVDLARIQAGPFYWGLPVTAEGSDLVEVKSTFPEYLTNDVSVIIDATLGTTNSVDVDATRTYRGTAAAFQSTLLNSSDRNSLQRRIKSTFRELGKLEDGEASFSQDEETGDVTVKFVGQMKLKNSQTNQKRRVKIPGFSFRPDFPLAYGSKKQSDDRETPFRTTAPINSRMHVVITLPEGFSEIYSYEGSNFGYENNGVKLVRKLVIEDRVATFERTVRVEVPEASAEDVFDLRFRLKDFSDKRSQNLVTFSLDDSINKKKVKSSDGNKKPKTKKQQVWALIESGNDYLNSRNFELAKAEFDAALNLDPSNSYAWANRAIVSIWQSEFSEGRGYLDKALELDAKNSVALQGYGFYHERTGDCVAGLRYFKQVIRSKPSSLFSRFREISCLAQLDRFDEARSKLKDMEKDFADTSQTESLRNYIDGRENWINRNKDNLTNSIKPDLSITMPKIEISIEE